MRTERRRVLLMRSRWSSISPDIWWSRYGGDYPELQRLVIRALSQTYNCASKYQLRRSLEENLLTNKGRRNPMEQQRLEDLTFVHYNLQLQRVVSTTETEEIDPMSDWVVDNDVRSNDPSSSIVLMDYNNNNINNDKMTTTTTAVATSEMMVNIKEGCSAVIPKEKPK